MGPICAILAKCGARVRSQPTLFELLLPSPPDCLACVAPQLRVLKSQLWHAFQPTSTFAHNHHQSHPFTFASALFVRNIILICPNHRYGINYQIAGWSRLERSNRTVQAQARRCAIEHQLPTHKLGFLIQSEIRPAYIMEEIGIASFKRSEPTLEDAAAEKAAIHQEMAAEGTHICDNKKLQQQHLETHSHERIFKDEAQRNLKRELVTSAGRGSSVSSRCSTCHRPIPRTHRPAHRYCRLDNWLQLCCPHPFHNRPRAAQGKLKCSIAPSLERTGRCATTRGGFVYRHVGTG